MKNFFKMTLATLAGLAIFCFAGLFIMIAMIGAVAALGEKQPVMPAKAMLTIDMSTIMLSEQTKEADLMTMLQGGESVAPLGIYSAIAAINKAAVDPAVQFIYMRPDGMASGVAHLEEFRAALSNFRNSGKAIVSYIENPTNGSYYLASVSDKVYMTPYDGGVNMFSGLSSQLIFLKDILDKVGVNIQLIRHGKYKSAGEMFIRSSSSKENLEQNEAMIDSMWESWAEQIAASREISVKRLNTMLDNLELVLPSDWVDNGLVDELLTREQLQQQLSDLYISSNYGNVKSISLQDYALLNAAPALTSAKSKIAVIYAEGNIVDGSDNMQVAGDRFARIISDVRKDTTIKAVVLRVNSPGGSVLAAEKIKAEVDLLQERVPVIASYGDYAASGGYWISACCDKIYTDATTLTGSIGVFSIVPDFSGTLNSKLHVNVTPVNSNKHADMYNCLRPLTKAETEYMQATVENVYKRFTSIVAEGRNMSVAQVENLAQGRVWTGAEAVANGLADEIGNIEDALQYAAFIINGNSDLSKLQIVEYPKPQTTLEMLMESLGGSTPSVLAGTPFENIEAAFSTAQATETGKTYARLPYEYVIR